MSTEVTPGATASLTQRVGKEIKVAMLRADVTGRQLATRLNVSQTWVSTRLTGATPIDLDDLDRIARALGVSMVDLLPREAVRSAADLDRRDVRPNARSAQVPVRPAPHPVDVRPSPDRVTVGPNRRRPKARQPAAHPIAA